MQANREFKSTVFTALFSDPEKLLELYNAVSKSELPRDTPLKIITLDNILFSAWRNDLAFTIADKIVILMEHQSTINENMPLRLLIYLARVYEKLIERTTIYQTTLLKIPRPDFIVLYNGAESAPDEETLRLSDAYKELPADAVGLGGSLELTLRVVNINIGRNENMVAKCEYLHGYVQLVQKIRSYQKERQDLTAAVTQAVDNCIKEGILTEFLKTHATEVINMLTAEWKLEEAQEVWKREGWEKGQLVGREEGRKEGRMEGRMEGIDISAEIMSALVERVPAEDIARRYNVSLDSVERLRAVLTMYSGE